MILSLGWGFPAEKKSTKTTFLPYRAFRSARSLMRSSWCDQSRSNLLTQSYTCFNSPGFKVVQTMPAIPSRRDDADLVQHGEVFGDGRLRQPKPRDQRSGAPAFRVGRATR